MWNSALHMIRSPDLVLAVRGQKNGGGGRGRERRKRDLAKYDCVIRLRGPESGPRVNCACPKSDMLSCVQYRHRVRYTALRFALKTWFSKFKA